MKEILLATFVAASTVTLVVSAQKRVAFDGKMDYPLTAEKQPSSAVAAWWPPFVQQNTLEGYCWNLNTLPLVDRPQLGDKARILRVGGAGQLTQVIEIPPGRIASSISSTGASRIATHVSCGKRSRSAR